jgi:molybdenum cofactor biosynthesis protein B
MAIFPLLYARVRRNIALSLLEGSMGVHDHKDAAAAVEALPIRVVVVSSSRTEATDASGTLLTTLLEGAGHTVSARTVVPDDVARIQAEVRGASADGSTRVLLLTGGTGMSARDVTPEAVEPLFTRSIPGFGELFRWLSYQDIGSAAILSRATAGLVGGLLVVTLPGSPDACRLAVEKLLLPELKHLVRELTKEAPAPTPKPTPAAANRAAESATTTAPEPPALPAPSGTVGRLGRGSVQVAATEATAPVATAGSDAAAPPTGWQRAIYEIRGELTTGTWPTLPQEVEAVAPVVDVIHTARERGTLKLPSGRSYAVFGFPDLKSPTSKVLAVGDGSPLGEVLALHRYPVHTGTCVAGSFALLPHRGADVAQVCEAVTGRAPPDASGTVFAVQGDSVWIERGSRAIRWDGTRERDDGTLKQVLASLVLDWSRR